MSGGNLSQAERLGAELKAIRRDEARLSQQALSEISGVGTTTIKDAEKGAQIPKADTLKLLADGLATYGPGRKDVDLAETYYRRLMRAAGYIEDRPVEVESSHPAERPSDEALTDGLEQYSGDHDAAISLLTISKHWDRIDPPARRFLEDLAKFAAEGDDEPPPARRGRR
jgi:transcriptional regulator with XRE-family HTH domain